MTLLRRAPREIYRVYSEEEYLGGAGSELIGEIGEVADQGGGQRRLQRAAGAAMLAGAVGAVSCLVVLNIARQGGGGARGSVVATTHPASTMHAGAFADAQPEVTSSRPAFVRAAQTKRSHVPPIRRSPANPVPRRPAHLPIHLPVHRQIDVAVVADYVPRPSSGEVSEAPVSTPASMATASTGAAPATPPVEKRPEFGFER